MYKAQHCWISSLVSVTRGNIAHWSRIISSATDNEGKMVTVIRVMGKEVECSLDDLERQMVIEILMCACFLHKTLT